MHFSDYKSLMILTEILENISKYKEENKCISYPLMRSEFWQLKPRKTLLT